MEYFSNDKTKFDWTNITDDYKKMQQISGISAVVGFIVSILVLMNLNVSPDILHYVTYIGVLLGSFTVVYYLFPSIYTKRSLQFLPDLVYVLGIASLMLFLGEDGDFFFIFMILIIAMNAFAMSAKLYALSIFEIISALLMVHLLQGHITFHYIEKNVLFHFYGVIIFATILRIFALENISLRRKQEELAKRTKQLSAQKKEIFLLIDNISEGLVAVDKERNITLINKSSLKLLGMIGNVNKLVGKNIENIFNISSSEGRISLVEDVINNKKPIMRDDLRLVRHDRTIRLHTNAAPIIDESKTVVGAIVLFRDITTKKEIEEQREEFNAIASHELRTPLTVLEGYLYYILSDKRLKYDKKTKEYIEKSHEAADALLQLSNDVLTVIKADENKIILNIENTDLVKIVKEVVKNFTPKAKAAGISLTSKVPKDLVTIKTDQQKVREILTNLIENAIKFTEKGKIVIEVNDINGREILISITDTGIGIAPDDKDMIFHKFYRTEDWQTRKTGGSGLGLYISKTFVSRLGGKIDVESSKGKGSRFWFTLPINGKAPKKRTKKTEAELNEFIKSL